MEGTVSTPPASPAQPQGNPNWITDEPAATADTNPPNVPYGNAYTRGDLTPGAYAADKQGQRDSAQTGPVQSDYIQDDTWTGPAVVPQPTGYPRNPRLRGTPMLAPRGQSGRAPSKLVQILLVLLALLLVIALAATLVVYQPGSLATVLPEDSQEVAQTGDSSDVFVVPERREESEQNAADDTPNDALTESGVDNPSVAAPADPQVAPLADASNADEAAPSTAPPAERSASMPTAAQLFVQAAAAFNNDEWLQAVEFYEQVRALDAGYQPERVEENLRLAYSNAAAQLLAEDAATISTVESALQLYRQALALAPDEETTQAQSERLNSFIVGSRALRLRDPETAIERLGPFLENADDPLSELATSQLYNAYLLLGDEFMRADSDDRAVENFNAAAALDVADPTALVARLTSLSRLELVDVSQFNAAAQALIALPLPDRDAAASTAADDSVVNDSVVDDSAAEEAARDALAAVDSVAVESAPAVQATALPTTVAPIAIAPTPVPSPTVLPTALPTVLPTVGATETEAPTAGDVTTATDLLTTTDVATAADSLTATAALSEESETDPVVRSTPSGCAGQRAVITQPLPSAAVSGVITVRGSAMHEDFGFYKLEFSPVGAENVAWFAGGERPVTAGSLGTWDTTDQPNGDYLISLTVVDDLGNYPSPCSVRVRVQN